MDHRLLGPAEVERRPLALHRLPDGAHVRVRIAVEELEEQGEVLRIALVGRRGQQQDVIGAVAQQLAQPVALALVGFVARRHPVRLVHDHQIPVRLPQSRKDVAAFGKVERRDDLLLLEPLVDAELFPDVAALEDEELLVELLLELALPLEGEVRGAHDEDPFGEAPELELPDEKPRHDGLAGAGVVGEEEAHGGQLEEVFVDRFELVGKRVHAGDGEAEEGIELVGDAEGVRLEPEAEQPCIAVVGEGPVGDGEARDVLGRQRDPTEPFRPDPDQAGIPCVGAVRMDGLDPHGLVEELAGENLPFE